MESMRIPSERVILRLLRARRQIKNEEKSSMARSMTSKLLGVIPPVIATGRARTMQILKILLPTMLPTRRSDSPCFAAVMVVTSSGKEVPNATMEREMIRSEIPIALAIALEECTTSSLPPITPMRPRITRMNDLPSLYLGFSTFRASFLFLRAIAMR